MLRGRFVRGMLRPMTHRHRLCTLTAALLASTTVWSQDGSRCANEPEAAKRLACYDRLFKPDPDATAAPPPAAAASAPAPTQPLPSGSTSIMSRLWELDDADKRRKFVVRTHLPNYLLPLHYTSNLNRAPASPTRAATAPNERYRPVEAKLQVSLRAKAASDVLLPDADLWVAYTQRSLWQLWNSQESAPFRSSDYQPEAIYVVPVPEGLRTLPFGWQWRMVQAGFAHQSNGQAVPLSRSWNRVYFGAGFERNEFGLQWKLHRRVDESRSDDDNPDLTNYIGRGELQATWLPGTATASLVWRTNLRAANRGSLQLDLTYPVDSDEPAGLRWYMQVFSGYGETLLDYNHRQTTLGLGLSLFQF
jgi:phospholipase A1/A2